MVCDMDDVFLQSSVNVQVLVITNELGQSPCTIESTLSTEIFPEQLSTAVNETGAGTSDEHDRFKFAGASGRTGAIWSDTVIV
ncbi:hypothetical protein FLJC2902T_30880 [Flavobacterium limnosediminis JC2902]|uniref:Uncharacterized protein n=1 Tax=Flavobacterium limnosediminis JC2902 TaxID=1341181 RepID=V6SLL4_9FLAO|nr:hypothetical protein FLJC2902T_30880 [Flavobacterium limnosediminis JC2902]